MQSMRPLSTLIHLLYCFLLGFVEVCLMHPLDLVKTRFQIQRGPDDPNRYTSLADCFRKMYRTEGYVEGNMFILSLNSKLLQHPY